ncbi:Uncharacterised protein [Bordetella pertussis]|nr:Uncharacterised protein [Bordetella pertussis]CFW39789.1 Uncharacterised protein [Bordetella pertussis]
MPHLGHEVVEGGIDRQAFDVDHQAVGVLQREVFRLELAVELERDARVLIGRPGAHGQDGGRMRQAGNDREDEQGRGDADQASAGGGAGRERAVGGGTIAFNHVCPRAVWAVRLASRPWSA